MDTALHHLEKHDREKSYAEIAEAMQYQKIKCQCLLKSMRNKYEIQDRLEKLQTRWDMFGNTLSDHEKGELLGQINALEWVLKK